MIAMDRRTIILTLAVLLLGAVCGYALAAGDRTIRASKIELTTSSGAVKAVIQTRRDNRDGIEIRSRSGKLLIEIP